MKKILLLAAFIAIIASCKKNTQSPSSKKQLLLSGLKVINADATISYSQFYYDDNNRLIKQTLVQFIGATVDTLQNKTYIYDANNNLIRVNNRGYTYKEITYKNGVPYSLFSKDPYGTSTMLYTVTGNKVTAIVDVNHSENKQLITYEGNNIKTYTSYPNAEVHTYTYGTNKSPLINAPGKWFLFYDTPTENYYYFIRYPAYFAANEPKQEVETDVAEGPNTTSYTYTYNADGYPLTAVRNGVYLYAGNFTENISFEYVAAK